MRAQLLAALFDMVQRHVSLLDFSETPADQRPAFDLYLAQGRAVHEFAMTQLVEAGLAETVEFAGLVAYRLNHVARAALAE